MLHPLPCLITFNIVVYLNERELNKSCGVSSICNWLHIELHLTCSVVCAPCHAMPCFIKPDMHHTWLCIMPCLCLCIYYVACFFPVLLLSFGNVAFVGIRSNTSVCLLHGLVLLPCGISGKMIIPSISLLSLLASCLLFCYAYAAIPTTCLSCLPYCEPSL